MRGVRLPLPRQPHCVHLTARDHLIHHRPTSHELWGSQDREPDTSDLTPYWDLAHPGDSEHE